MDDGVFIRMVSMDYLLSRGAGTMNFTDYKQINAINATAIKAGVVSMLNMHATMTGPGKETTPAMRMGTLLHTAVLEPDRFAAKVHVWDGTKRGKAYTEFAEDKDPFWILSEKEYTICDAVRESVWAKTAAYKLIEGAEIEKSITWDDPACGPCKARLDVAKPTMICDFKTTANMEPGRFAVTCAQLHYHLQMGFYARGHEQITGTFPTVSIIAAEQKPPFDCAVYAVPEYTVRAGARRAVDIACEYRDAMDRGELPGVDRGEVLELDLPSWAEGMDSVPELVGPGSWSVDEMNGTEVE